MTNGAPVLYRTQTPVGDRVPRRVPSLCSTCAPRRLRFAVSRAYPPATSTDCPVTSKGAGSDSLACRPGADQPLRFFGHAPPYPPPGHFATFRAYHRRLCRSSAGGDRVPASDGNSVGDRPAIASPFAPLPVIQLRSRQ